MDKGIIKPVIAQDYFPHKNSQSNQVRIVALKVVFVWEVGEPELTRGDKILLIHLEQRPNDVFFFFQH